MALPCGKCGIELLPLAVFLILPTTFITTYLIAVLLGHVEPDFPYISDTGTQSPESCIFGQFVNISAVLIGLTIYVRYKQVEEFNRNSPHLLKWNRISLIVGLLAALGLSMVGNFQETNVKAVHLTGALMAFGLGTLFSWIQTYMSHHMHPHMITRGLVVFRLFICIGMTFCFIITGISGMYSFCIKSHDTNPMKWQPHDKGFTAHVISTASEWGMSLFFLIYFATFIHEFKQFTITTPQVYLFISRSSQPRQNYDDPDDVMPISA